MQHKSPCFEKQIDPFFNNGWENWNGVLVLWRENCRIEGKQRQSAKPLEQNLELATSLDSLHRSKLKSLVLY